MRARRTVVALALAVSATSSLVSCGSSGGAKKSSGATGDAAEVTAAVCSAAAAAKKTSLPARFPKDFPFPKGTTIYSADDRGTDGIVITGVTSTAFADVLTGLQQDLPKHGYHPDAGETEPHDAESDWKSASYVGRWAIREIPQCPGDTLVNVVARPAA